MGFEITLAKIRLHAIVFYWRVGKVALGALVLFVPLILLANLGVLPIPLMILLMLVIIAGVALLAMILHSLWQKSALYITNRRVYIEVHRRPWNIFSTDLYLHNMRDTAYSYHTFLGRIFHFGTLFARNSNEDDNAMGLVVNHLPYPEIVRDYLGYLTAIEADKRMTAIKFDDFHMQRNPKAAKVTDTDMRKKMLQLVTHIKGITGGMYLTEADKDILWMNEEERNLGVFETLMRKHVLVVTHDSKLRPPAADIVVQRASRIVFPAVPFPEVPQKDVVSCSPGLKAHQFLATRIEVKGDDATLLIGWN